MSYFPLRPERVAGADGGPQWIPTPSRLLESIHPVEDLPIDHLPAEAQRLVTTRQPNSLFRSKNREEYLKEMSHLVPAEFGGFDPEHHPLIGQIIDSPGRHAVVWGLVAGAYHNYATMTPWYKVPWRIPLWMAAYYPIACFATYQCKLRQFEYRRNRLIANNYFKRVREAVVDREQRKRGAEGLTFDDDMVQTA
eukprot:NODE_7369_length_771_cov_134.231481_g7127_i0.p1 GENE.NODE_7369_length_771_cov_134.231481_g7127_i0~~NODE_7369_length_771_cov_134.231481_g7127_i0.p1  ORF type:complete len:194 (-),score=36.39 NODE_7369_length_771_cov_134.231481_g7127_i0:140-721(-)